MLLHFAYVCVCVCVYRLASGDNKLICTVTKCLSVSSHLQLKWVPQTIFKYCNRVSRIYKCWRRRSIINCAHRPQRQPNVKQHETVRCVYHLFGYCEAVHTHAHNMRSAYYNNILLIFRQRTNYTRKVIIIRLVFLLYSKAFGLVMWFSPRN